MLPAVESLLRYELWANRETLASIERIGPEAGLVRWFAHILAAQQVWLARLQGDQDPAAEVWPASTLEQCSGRLSNLEKEIETYCESLAQADLDRSLEYFSTQGGRFSNSIQEILTHVGLHSHYHRGQIAARIRELGGQPAATDYIFYSRQQAQDPLSS